MPNLYENNAKFYDYYEAQEICKKDMEFYLQMASMYENPILELCCGTGRIALELARNGHEIHGIDLSQQMLRIFEDKLSREPLKVRELIKVFQMDMKNFELPYKYGLIIIPANSFMFLVEEEDALHCLECMKKHLLPHGRIIIALHNYNYVELLIPQKEEIMNVTFLPDDKHIKFIQWVEWIDFQNQLISCGFRHDTFLNDTCIDSSPVDINISKYYNCNQIEVLAGKANIIVENIFGSFDLKLFNENSELIIVDCYVDI